MQSQYEHFWVVDKAKKKLERSVLCVQSSDLYAENYVVRVYSDHIQMGISRSHRVRFLAAGYRLYVHFYVVCW